MQYIYKLYINIVYIYKYELRFDYLCHTWKLNNNRICIYIYIFKYTYKWQSLASYSTLYIMYMFQRMLIDTAQYKVVPHG